jgi:hypothetical protein
MPDTDKGEQSSRIPPKEGPMRTQHTDPSLLARLLDEWMHGDEVEQRETFETLRQSLDEDRLPGYKLFS